MGARSTNPTQSFFDDFFRSGTEASGSNVPGPVSVTGGDATFTYNSKKIHVFTSSGALTVVGGSVSLEVFMIGGGGGGGGYCGGGGGAGGLVTHADITCNEGPNSVVIGTGGARRSNGTDTTFLGMTAKGGGHGAEGGGAGGAHSPGGSGGGGGSGPGGGGSGNATQPSQNSPFTPDPNFAQYGNAGGSVSGSGGNYSSNGGGGAGGAGDSNPNNGPGGDGGAGRQIPTTFRDPSNTYGGAGPGSPYGWFGGGGGGSNSTNGGAPSDGSALGAGGQGPNRTTPYSGGGGAGQTTAPGAATINPISGHANTGGGGGGGEVVPGTPAPTGNPLGNGGSGIVMVAFDV